MEEQEHSIMPNREHVTPRETRSRQLDAPIDLLPEELLLCIFKILIDYDPLFVGRLLFVSRYWHHIVQNTPFLWSKILIKPQVPNDIVKYHRYVKRALGNSSNLPLDLTIDLYHLYTYLIELNPGVSYGLTLARHRADLTSLFEDVVGYEGANVVRWRSFRLCIQINNRRSSGIESAVDWFMKELHYPTPKLESLFLHMNSIGEFFPPIGGPLQDLRSLRHLMVDAGGRLGHIKYVPRKIEVLRLRLWGSTKVMAPFINLRELSISIFLTKAAENDPVITFPLLECLTLDLWSKWYVGYAIVLSQKIRAPILNTLRLLDDEAYVSVADATAFHHIRALELLSTQSSPAGILNFLKSHLRNYTALTSLTVCPWHLDTVMPRMSSLKDQGRVPVGLDVLYTVVSNRDGIAPDIGNAKKILCMWRSPSDYIYRPRILSRRDVGIPESGVLSQ